MTQQVDFSNPNADKITSTSTTKIKQEINLKCFDCNDSLQDCPSIEDKIDMK